MKYKTMRYYPLLLIFVLCCSFVVAETSEFIDLTKYYKVGTNISISAKCENDGTGALCSGSSECNLSVDYPNGQSWFKNEPMTYDSPYFIYNLSDTDVLGKYSSTMCCADDTEYACSSFNFVINNIGSNDNDTAYMAIILMSILIVFSIILTIFFYMNDSFFKYMFLVFDFLFPAVLFYFAYLLPANINNSISKLFLAFGIIFSVLTVVILVLIALDITIMLIIRARDAMKRKESNEWGSELF